jgi:hypothetical protein
MKESEVSKAGEGQGRVLPDAPSAPGQDAVRNTSEPAERRADDEWLDLAAADPAFFINPSDTV